MNVFFMFSLSLLFLIIISLLSGNAKHVEGVVNSFKDFVFLTGFVFQPGEYGEMDYTFTYQTSKCCYQMLIFNDEPNQWPYIQENEDFLDCMTKKSLIPSHYNGKVTLSTSHNCIIRTNSDTEEEEFYCHGTRHFNVIEERWWYITIVHCGGDGIHNFHYNMEFINGKHNFDNHFSADERYILQTDTVFLGLYLIVCSCLLKFRKLMLKRQTTYYQLFSYSCYLQTISLLFQTIAFWNYASNGVGFEPLKKLGKMISSTSALLFALLLIGIAKGYTVTRVRLKLIKHLKITVFACVYLFAAFGLYIVHELVYDARNVISKSFLALAIVVLQFIGLAWIYYDCYCTITQKGIKITFCVPFAIGFTLWFIGIPTKVWLSEHFVKWKTAKIVNGLEVATMFYGHILYLIWTHIGYRFQSTNIVDIVNHDDKNQKERHYLSHVGTTEAKYVTKSEYDESSVIAINVDIVNKDGEL
ncbi:transmembrane protein 145-like [Antedon mediterranea]|uniref:transmembrane protein 145-like n=1 Tax=Antedon mediterranea TaxID=105859 RepID=UPI003AF7BB9F